MQSHLDSGAHDTRRILLRKDGSCHNLSYLALFLIIPQEVALEYSNIIAKSFEM
jgi:hypothetical protein